MPDPDARLRYALTLAEELQQFERPMPVMDEYDALLKHDPEGPSKVSHLTEGLQDYRSTSHKEVIQ